jgi:hypothetical protein
MPARYELLIVGPAGPMVTSAFEDIEVRPAPPGRSRIEGTLADEAALHGVLHRLQDLHVELVEVRRLDAP